MFQHPPDNLPDEDAQADLYEFTRGYLNENGFGHYEISNFCRPGGECLHNLNYWHGGEYVGLGPAAASHRAGQRYTNRANLPAYLDDPLAGREQDEGLDIKRKAAETAMLELRLLQEGLDPVDLSRCYGAANTREIIRRLEQLVSEKCLSFDGVRYRLLPERILTSNPILGRVLG